MESSNEGQSSNLKRVWQRRKDDEPQDATGSVPTLRFERWQPSWLKNEPRDLEEYGGLKDLERLEEQQRVVKPP
jgi:hypothetical protein